MKQILLSIAGIALGALLSTCPLNAQTASSNLEELAQLKTLVKNNPPQATEVVEQLLKGKSKKDPAILSAIGQAYLEAGEVEEAQKYATQATKADPKSSTAYVLEGDIAFARKDIGTACQFYEQAIYFDPQCKEAYLKYANVYRNANPQIAIEKLNELKALDATYTPAHRALAELYYSNNKFAQAADAYAPLVNSPEATDEDITKYAFALFLNHDFDKSLQVVQKGLARNPRHAAFNRLAMYNYADLKRYDEGLKAADLFFNTSDNPDFAYLDYLYYGYLLSATKQYDEAIAQFHHAMNADGKKANLWREISEAHENKGDYDKAIECYTKYQTSLPADKQNVNAQLKLGKLYYSKGTSGTEGIAYTDTEKADALKAAAAIFADVANQAPDSYLGCFWQARAHSALDPETTQGLAKPYYEAVITQIADKSETGTAPILVECYSYLGYYHLVASNLAESKTYWNKILEIDPGNATAQKALEGIN